MLAPESASSTRPRSATRPWGAALLGFERRVALRFLREGRMQTLLIVVGVAAGVAVVAYISALITGLQSNTLEKTLGAQSHISIQAPDAELRPSMPAASGTAAWLQTQPRAQRLRSVDNWPALMRTLEALPEVAAVSPMVSGAGLAQRGEASKSIALMGVDLDRYDRIVQLRRKVVAGQPRLGPGETIIGRELATDLGLRVGDRLVVLTGQGSTAVSESLRITALVDLGVRDLNRRTVITPLRTAQSLEGLPGGATHVDVTLHDVWAAKALAEQLGRRLPYKVESWQQSNAQLVSALNAQSVSTSIIRGVVMIVVVLGIASVLVVSVVQKQREIGILRAMGATRGQLLRVFLLQGAIVGAAGSALGIALAALLIAAFTAFVKGSDGLPLFAISLAPALALNIAAMATVCGVLAAVAPARRAAALDPAQAIRL
jgi:lipoprotein-releasing system permease protein